MRRHRPWMGARHVDAAGFTVVEALVVAVIACILVSIVVPAFAGVIARSRAIGSMHELHGLLNLARGTAIASQVEVTVCGATPEMQCAATWSRMPTVVFIDGNANRRADPGETLLAQSELSAYGTIRWRGSAGRAYLRYRASGSPREIGNFVWCPADRDPRHARTLIVAATGRTRSGIDANHDGIVEDAGGNPVSCE